MDTEKAIDVIRREFSNLWVTTDRLFGRFPTHQPGYSKIEKDLSEIVLDSIIGAYSEPWRTYHGPTHLAYGYRAFHLFEAESSVKLSPIQKALFGWSWNFHDFRCWPGASDNEERSARAIRWLLGNLGAPWGFDETVDDIIKATETHRIRKDLSGWIEEEILILKLVLDVDMASFGVPSDVFDFHGEQLLKEALAVGTSKEEFEKRRRKFLEGLLEMFEQDLFYKLNHFKCRYGGLAYDNITRALRR